MNYKLVLMINMCLPIYILQNISQVIVACGCCWLHLDLLNCILVYFQVGIVRNWSEHIPSDAKVSERHKLRGELAKPNPVIAQRRVEEIHNDASEIDIRHSDDIEVSEAFQSVDVLCRLSVDTSSLSQVTYRPDDGKHHSAAADKINNTEDVFLLTQNRTR